jgi:hypothetical protein
MNKPIYTKLGKWSIICGTLGLITIYIYHAIFTNIAVAFILIILAIIAIALGISARKTGDLIYGRWGIILGVIVFILQIVINLLKYYFVWT